MVDQPRYDDVQSELRILSNSRVGSLEYAVARDKLIAMKVLPDDPVVELTDEYWEQFKEKNGE